jgi:putative PIN family toxin of toxin-antitoxin system
MKGIPFIYCTQNIGIDIKIGIIYNTNVSAIQIVVDTNVFVTALRSKHGASYKFFQLIKKGFFQLNLSVPLAIEYETVSKRTVGEITLDEKEVDDILDFVISKSNRWQIFYLWRPELNDPGDDMVLELAVTANCQYIVTYNVGDFKPAKNFGITAITPKEFLQMIGEL